MTRPRPRATLLALLLAAPAGAAERRDAAMLGGDPSRNMASDEKGLPDDWDPETGRGILWRAALGSQTYGGPVVAGGVVFVGTNNEARKNPKLEGDRGVVMAFDARTGELVWQSTHTKLPAGRVNDWPLQGVCSTPYVEGERLYYLSNRAELVAADTEGFRDGEDDGPYREEAARSPIDADLVWKFDLIAELDVFPHNLAASSPLVAEGLLFAVTGNGVDEGHVNLPSPAAPSFVALEAASGKLVWASNAPGERILHGSWSSPAYGTVGGRPQVVFAGGDGWVYAFEPRTGAALWKFDGNPKDSVWELGGAGTRNNIIATPVLHDDKVFIAVGQDPEHGEGAGHLWAIDATGSGDVTGSGVVWHLGGEDFHRSLSTVAIQDGLLYAADLSGFLYCIDVKTGSVHWTHNVHAAVWGSPLVADGKVYLGDEDGDVAILRAGPKRELIREIHHGSAVYTTPYAKDGVLYVASRNQLFAVARGAGEASRPASAPAAGAGGKR